MADTGGFWSNLFAPVPDWERQKELERARMADFFTGSTAIPIVEDTKRKQREAFFNLFEQDETVPSPVDQSPVEPTPAVVQNRQPFKTVVQPPVTKPKDAPIQQAGPLAGYNTVMNQEPGFFQENAPLILGLLGGVSGLLEASGPSRVPVSGGQVFARGLQSGLKGYMGGLDYQMGMDKARQQEASNILKSLEQKGKIQIALDRRESNKQMKLALPQMIVDINTLENLTPRDKIRIKHAEKLIQASPETSFNILNEIAGRTGRYNFINSGGGVIVRTDRSTGESEIISGSTDQARTNLGAMPYDDIPGKTELERALLVLRSAPRDSKNYQVAWDIFSQPKMSATGTILQPNPQSIGILPPLKAGEALQETTQEEPVVGDPVPADGTVIQKTELPAATVTKIEKLKAIPVSTSSEFEELEGLIEKVEEALKLMDDPGALEAIGRWDEHFPPEFQTDEGIKLRGIIAEISSAILLERSGAAVTESEFRRAQPFLPEIGAPERKTKVNLQMLKDIFNKGRDRIAKQYTPAKGYRWLVKPSGSAKQGKAGPPESKKAMAKRLNEKFSGLDLIEVKPAEDKGNNFWWLAPR